jgi:hypothetical protein
MREMFEDDFADKCANKILIMSMGGQAFSICRPGREDPHRFELKSSRLFYIIRVFPTQYFQDPRQYPP